jgi:hypothetical protein
MIEARLLETAGADDTGTAVSIPGSLSLIHEEHPCTLIGSGSGRHRSYWAAAHDATVIVTQGFHTLVI